MVLCESFMLKGWAKVLTEKSASLEEQTVSKNEERSSSLSGDLQGQCYMCLLPWTDQHLPRGFSNFMSGEAQAWLLFQGAVLGSYHTEWKQFTFGLCKWHASPHSRTLPPTRITKFLGYIRGGIFTDLPRLGWGWVSDFKIWQEEAKSLPLFLMKSQHRSFCSHRYPSLCLDLRAFKCFLKLISWLLAGPLLSPCITQKQAPNFMYPIDAVPWFYPPDILGSRADTVLLKELSWQWKPRLSETWIHARLVAIIESKPH